MLCNNGVANVYVYPIFPVLVWVIQYVATIFFGAYVFFLLLHFRVVVKERHSLF